MSVIYSNALKDTRMQAVQAAIDGGGAAGSIEVCTASYAAVLASIPLVRPSFSEAAQAITMLGVPRSATASATGTATVARIKDSTGAVVVNGLTVGTAGSDIVMNAVAVTSGQTVTITSGAILHG